MFLSVTVFRLSAICHLNIVLNKDGCWVTVNILQYLQKQVFSHYKFYHSNVLYAQINIVIYLSFNVNFLSFSLAQGSPRDLQKIAYK